MTGNWYDRPFSLWGGGEMTQLTDKATCKQKHTYHSYKTAKRAKDRRNKAAGINYLRAYKCNTCNFWHVTTEVKEADPKSNVGDNSD